MKSKIRNDTHTTSQVLPYKDNYHKQQCYSQQKGDKFIGY